MPAFSRLVTNNMTTPISISPYPPPIMVKHSLWRHNNADLFISINGLTLHRRRFENSHYFQLLLAHLETERLFPRGRTFSKPLAFDNLSEPLFTLFLCLLYDEENFTATEDEWYAIKRLSINWQFGHQTAIALRMIAYIREQRIPRIHRRLVNGLMTRGIREERTRRPRLSQRQAPETERNSNDEGVERIVDDNST